MYIAKKKVETITKNTILQAEDFGGWQAFNTGTTTAIVDEVPISPGGSIVGLSFTDLHPEVIWGDPISITFSGSGINSVVITRLKYSKL